MPIRFKQQCGRCRKNYVKVSRKQYFVLCYDCQKGELAGEVKDPEMKKMFAIPEEFYKDNAFLRDIKVKYLRYGSLSEKQVDAFKKGVASMRKAAKATA